MNGGLRLASVETFPKMELINAISQTCYELFDAKRAVATLERKIWEEMIYHLKMSTSRIEVRFRDGELYDYYERSTRRPVEFGKAGLYGL